MSDSTSPVGVETPTPALAMPAAKSALTLWALIVAIVAMVSAIIPVLSFVAWAPALVATILGIVGLATKRPGGGKALTAVILGPVALLVAVVVSLVTIAGISNSLPSTDSKPNGIADAPAEAQPEAPALGTRENPAPAGSTVVLSDNSGEVYEITFGAATLDAGSIIAAENMFNEPADAGSQYILVPVTFTYVGTETGTPWLDVQFAFVSAAGTTHDSSSSFVVAPLPLTDINELYPGATATANLVLMVPSADIEKGALTVSPLFGEKYFVALV